MSNKQSALTLAKSLVRQDARLYAEENPKALTPAQRTANIEAKAKYKEQLQAVSDSLSAVEKDVVDGSQLLTAAEFVCDVNGDDPSIPELKLAVQSRQEYLAMKEQRQDLEKAIRQCDTGMHSRRYQINEYVNGPIPMNVVLAYGDTWSDVCEQLRKEQTRQQERKSNR